MPRLRLRHAFVAAMVMVAMLLQGTWALAATTGVISGQVVDRTTGAGVADASVTVSSASQVATTKTDASGHYVFLTLGPDTYTVSATKNGYASVSRAGVTVFADQTQTVTLVTEPLKTIASLTSRAAGNLVKPGTTADVYSVNAATQEVVGGSGGGFNLNQAYSGIYNQPGVTSYIGGSGWGQVFYIRGSPYSATGYEFDGVPVNRAFDNYQSNSLSSLGQQELQVYTGGSPSSSTSASVGGFINQVIRTGTYPGFGTLQGGLGFPGFYHALTAEAGGASPNRNFSYYVGIQGYNQHYPSGNWNNFGNVSPNGLNQYGLLSASEQGTLTGALFCFTNVGCADGGIWPEQYNNGPFGPCQTSGANAGEPLGYTVANPGTFNGACYGYYPWNLMSGNDLSEMFERDNVVNLHFAIPHHFDTGRDDVQLLWTGEMQYQPAGDGINDSGGLALLNAELAPWAPFNSPGNPNPGLCGYYNIIGNGFAHEGCATLNSPIPYADTRIFAPGSYFGEPVSSTSTIPYWMPNSPTNRALNQPCMYTSGALAGTFPSFGHGCFANTSASAGCNIVTCNVTGPTIGLSPSLKDASWNDVGIVKAQYTRNLSPNAFARIFGYSLYSDWFLNGPVAVPTCYLDALLCGGQGSGAGLGWFGGIPGDYELTTHTRGAEFQFADQINPQNLLRLTANYTTATVNRFNNGTPRSPFSSSRAGISNPTNGDPNNPICYSYISGAATSCYSSTSYGIPQDPTRALFCSAHVCAISPTDPRWLVTRPQGLGTLNQIRPVFMTGALEDEFKPNDRLDLNIGLRFESFQYILPSLNTPEFNFWFNAYSQIVCYDPGTGQPVFNPISPTNPPPLSVKTTSPYGSCGLAPSLQEGLHPVGNTSLCADCGPLKYTAATPASFTKTAVSPRIAGTYTMSADDVLRFSYGKYVQPVETAFEEYSDQSGRQAAPFDFGSFWGYGFTNPAHDNAPQYSNNYDLSWEHQFKNTDITFKLTPFYRDAHNQLVSGVLGPNFVTATNIGHQHTSGVEFQIQKGDPTRDGWSGALSYTYTKALLQYGNLPNGRNFVDIFNDYIKAFNALTSAGGGSPCYFNDPATGVASGTACPANFALNPNTIVNPYYSMSAQGLLDRNGWYPPPHDEPPSDPNDQPTVSAIWPHQINGWVQYKHGRWSVAPNVTIESGSYYGSPTDIYGIDPRSCPQNQTAATDTNGAPIAGITPTSTTAGFCDFLSAGPSLNTESGLLAIPNPLTGKMDSYGQYQQPWIANVGALIKYDITPSITANLVLTNILQYCWGGSNTPWSSAFKPGNYVCGYYDANSTYLGAQSGQAGYGGGFYYGTSPGSASNGSPVYPAAFNYPFAPFTGALPFQAYFQVSVKL